MNVRSYHFRRRLAGIVVTAILVLPVAAYAQVAVIANGSPITEYDIAQRTKLIQSSTHKKPTRQEVINALIDDHLKIDKARSYGLVVSQEEVDKAFDTMAKRQGATPQQFKQFLARAGIDPATVKARLRVDLTWSQLVRGKFGPSLEISDADIAQAAQRGGDIAASQVGYVYTLYPIMVVVPAGSNKAVMTEKRREAEALRSRFVSCKQGLALARALRDVAVREPVTRSSAELPGSLRELLSKMELGHLTAPDVTAQGLQMFALCDKKSTSTASALKTKLRQEIFAKRFEAQSKKYLDEIRRSAMIEYK